MQRVDDIASCQEQVRAMTDQYLGEQLGIEDVSQINQYTERRNTPFLPPCRGMKGDAQNPTLTCANASPNYSKPGSC